MAKAHNKNLRVVIVGGSIAGLTLAHSLQKAQIDYVVLESNSEIAPQVGASIGILPSGARILDQLGVWDDVYSTVEALHSSFTWTEEGKLIVSGNIPEILHERHAYPTAFLDRQILLEIMYNRLGRGQEKVFLNKKVTRVEHQPDRVCVHCADDTVFEGDIVVGADGVRSTTRREMWRYMDSISLNKEAEKERNAMTSEYSCVFGISTATPGLTPGHSHRTYADGFSFLTVVGKNGRTFWFLFVKMDQKYTAANIPRFRKDDISDHVAPFMNKSITADVKFSDVYNNHIISTLLPLKEASYSHWTKGRFVCIGDSAHKMTPNMGQGGNSAIAVSLANNLVKLSKQTNLSQHEIEQCLQSWQTTRQPRATVICKKANALTRTEAFASAKDKYFTLHLLPWVQAHVADKISSGIVGAEKLDFLPLPARSTQATMPFIPNYDRLSEGVWKRAFWAVPLLACYRLGSIALSSTAAQFLPFLRSVLEKGTWTSGSGEIVDLTRPIYHIPFLDRIFRPMITCFLPSITGTDPLSGAQMLSFMVDIGPVYAIWLLETSRQVHSWAEVILPVSLGVAFQFVGIGKVAPLYYALEYLRTPLSKTILGSNRSISKSDLTSLAIAILAGYYIPTFGCFFAPSASAKQTYNAIWQLFPVLVPLLQIPFRLLLRSGERKSKPETKESTNKTEHADISHIRKIYIPLATLSLLTFLYARFTAPAGSSVLDIFFLRNNVLQSGQVTSLNKGLARFLQYDEIFGLGSGLIWLGLRFRELQTLGLSVNWWKVLGGLLGVGLIGGPGAAFTVGWGVREELLSRVA